MAKTKKDKELLDIRVTINGELGKLLTEQATREQRKYPQLIKYLLSQHYGLIDVKRV